MYQHTKKSVKDGFFVVGELNLGGSKDVINSTVNIAELAVEKGAKIIDELLEELEKQFKRKLHPWEYKYVEEFGDYCCSGNILETFLSMVTSNIVRKLEKELGRKLTSEKKITVHKLIGNGKDYGKIKSAFERKHDLEYGRDPGLGI